MTISRLREAANSYRSMSRRIAARYGHPQYVVLIKMLLARLLYNHGPFFYNLFDFETKRLPEWNKFLTKPEMHRMQMSLNGKIGDELATNKLLFLEKCMRCHILTPSVLALVACGINVPHWNGHTVSNPDELKDFFRRHDEQKMILKEDRGTYGSNLLFLHFHNGGLLDHIGNPISAAAVWNHCQATNANFMIQKHLSVHPLLKAIMPGLALGTMRIITFRNKSGEVQFADALIKIPVIGNVSDNFHQGDSGNLLGSVDLSSGGIRQVWGMKGGFPIRVYRHPNTDICFADRTIPFWDEILASVKKAAIAFDELTTIGWDVALTNEGIFIIEANSRYDIDGHQMVIMKGMREQIAGLVQFAQSAN